MKSRGAILMYHSVNESGDFFSVTPAQFRSQMELLHKRGYEVVSLPEICSRLTARTLSGKEVAITFDDGYRDNYTHAFPILKEFAFPATIFVTIYPIIKPRKNYGD